MGKRNHNKHKHSHTSNAPKKVEPVANQEELFLQCFDLHELLSHRAASLSTLDTGDLCYILSTKWLSDWKDYVGYDKLTKNEEGQKQDIGKDKKFGRRHPGKINSDISSRGDQYYKIPEELADYQYLNTFILPKKDKNDDYIAVTKQIWEAFLKYYEGEPILRPVRKQKSGFFYDSELPSYEVVFVNLLYETLQERIHKLARKSFSDVFQVEKMQLPTIWQFGDIVEFMQKYCLVKFQCEDMRIWKAYSYLATTPLCESIVEAIKDKSYLINGRLMIQEKLQGNDLDVFLKETHVLIVQVGTRFQQRPQEDQIFGYCEECVEKRKLIVHCQCNQVHYCSQKCRINDLKFHEGYCSQAFDSDDDEDFASKIVKDEPMVGLQNLGNTCYMNSVLQCLLSLEQLRKYFGQNGFTEQIDQKELKENSGVFLKKVSKFWKAMSLAKTPFVPWSLKGQIDYFLMPFKGDKQHDANDFLVHFLNTINDFLKKDNHSAYHRLFREEFIGSFTSRITCPQCTFEKINEQIFMQVTLPLKNKAKIKTYQYVIVENSEKSIKGKADVQERWTDMKATLGLQSNCLIFIAREPEGLVPIDEKEADPNQLGRKINGDVIYYPNVKYREEEQLFVFTLLSYKTIYGQQMRYPYGLPLLIGVETELTTLGTFWLQIIRYFYPNEEIIQQANAIQQGYFTAVEEITIRQSKLSQNETDIEKQSVQATHTNKEFSQRLAIFIKKLGINVFIQDFRRHKNTCRYCNKKCRGCELPQQMNRSFQEYFDKKIHETRFEVILKEKIEQTVLNKDHSQSGDITLHNCLELFNQPQQLDEENAWYCQQCDSMQMAFKQMHIDKFPKIFIIHFNRFKNANGKKVKNSEPIEYHEIETFGDSQYRLKGVIVHEGSIEGGHYYAICHRTQKYIIFNDTKDSSTDKICNKNAYILIYTRIQAH